MKTFVSKPVNVQAAQWDGSQASAKTLQKDFGLNHAEMALDEKGNVKLFKVGARKDFKNPVRPGDWFVKDQAGNVLIMHDSKFTAAFDDGPW